MKIGILTYHSPCNYGANLQAYSTYCALKNIGYNPVIINWYTDAFEQRYRNLYSKEQYDTHRSFIDRNFVLTKRCHFEKDVSDEIKRLGIKNVIVGSDATLSAIPFIKRFGPSTKTLIRFSRQDGMMLFPNPFWGSFLSNDNADVTMQMLSVSSQNSDYKKFFPSTKKKMRSALERFKFISVRDIWTRDMVSYLTEGNVVPHITPDPVFAFNINVGDLPSRDTIMGKYKLPDNYVLFGFKDGISPSKQWLDNLSRDFSRNGKNVVNFPLPEVKSGLDYGMKNIPPLDWYSIIRYADAYIGNNMHPIIMAIHNCVPFFSFDQYGIRKLLGKSIESASKIYHIIQQAEMSDLRSCAIRHKVHVPSEELVLKKILNFDKEKCGNFAAEQSEKFNVVLNEICANFQG